MIRDPSDGSIREKPEPVLETTTSGLRPEKAKEAVRLNESREWLKEYHARRNNRSGI